MISPTLAGNVTSWLAQVFVIASLGALLPLLFRIRHPRTQLAYNHLVLAACLLLPLMQPWHPRGSAAAMQPDFLGIGSPLEQVALWILAAGSVIRLGWLTAGMIRIRSYRLASLPVQPLPDPVRMAIDRVHASASFRLSQEVKSPATVGLLRPVVLFPESFMRLNSEWQHAIACHELLHVRRRDCLVTVIEEVVAAAFWFHPGVWWLLAQSRLAREQIVDSQVVRLTSARNVYIASLLAIAGTRIELDLVPAPVFLRKRHLTHRLHSLLEEVSMSKLRLVMSYTAIAAILAAAGWSLS